VSVSKAHVDPKATRAFRNIRHSVSLKRAFEEGIEQAHCGVSQRECQKS
jgi:hypothetical protein